MSHINVSTIQSAFRDVRRDIDITPFSTDDPEESIPLLLQKQVKPEEWGIETIETWSREAHGKISLKKVWDRPVYYLSELAEVVSVEFRFFMDGIQRTTPIGKIRIRKTSLEQVPLHFAQVGIALLERRSGKLFPSIEKIKILVQIPDDFIREESNRPELENGLFHHLKSKIGHIADLVDTSYSVRRYYEPDATDEQAFIQLGKYYYRRYSNDELWTWCTDPAHFRSHARRWTTRFRDLAEQDVYDEATEILGESVEVGKRYKLVVRDGPLTHVRGHFKKNAIGVIKSFGTLFLHPSQMTKVQGLPIGYRSPVFVATRPDGNPEETELQDSQSEKRNRLISWYVRIRTSQSSDPYFGLLRVEMHEESLPCAGHAGRWGQIDTEVIDAISRKLALEANPTCHPDPRWHNLIYPIRCCENYLRAKIIPRLTASMIIRGDSIQ